MTFINNYIFGTRLKFTYNQNPPSKIQEPLIIIYRIRPDPAIFCFDQDPAGANFEKKDLDPAQTGS